ncbi:unnamed protein product (macronuclear) [Paramecium tetraurelia]|uniref:Uncharacterized protein n=1 Tax=Paramecium tetraurelia TaxID=5888 RepID=A0CAY4_PARTE|nr:uncharacterized protein GSPATT00036732001 [Paramecium tetraurelia]CAK67951.1 unnamed protein product [Paramecium tetraurelia]|eukprot:XP_001435348.1 hypothetical protein (macronuclear) [Paramecium tetraurelia strain d4-2]
MNLKNVNHKIEWVVLFVAQLFKKEKKVPGLQIMEIEYKTVCLLSFYNLEKLAKFFQYKSIDRFHSTGFTQLKLKNSLKQYTLFVGMDNIDQIQEMNMVFN